MNNLMRKPSKDANLVFIAEDMILRDDAFQKSMDRFCGEWWYFDAVFDNGYSANAFVGVISKRDYGLILPILHIYKDSKPIFSRRELRCFNEFSASESMPHIQLSKKDFIKGYIDEETDSVVYDVLLEVGGQKIDLKFTGVTKGWKGETPASKWGVMLPRAIVKGTLTLNGETIKVNGRGYHDHNWGFRLPVTLKGWYWGRCGGDSFNLVWSKIMSAKSKDFLLAVLNDGKTDYVNINPEKIQVSVMGYTYDHGGKKIPDEFTVDVKDERIHINVRMKTIEAVRYIRMPFVKYWRYHVHATGHISYDERCEEIDQVEIIEFLKTW